MTAANLLRDLGSFSIQVAIVAIALAALLKVVHLPPRARYLCLRLALVACLVLPWMLRTAAGPPPVSPVVDAPDSATGGTRAITEPQRSAERGPAVRRVTGPASAIPWTELILGVLLIGAAGRALWLGVGLRRLRRLRVRSTVLHVPDYDDIQQQLGTCATIAQVDGLSQPATFGLRRPVVLLPTALAAAPETLRRAVVAHELFHVRRRDWLSVIGEECLRTALWFHPAILWLTSAIQLAREEIVDELSVRLTGDRRTYMQALLAFADSGGLRPAPAFAHRRHLFHRIVSVSKETVMSTPRTVTSAGLLVAAVFGATWYSSTLFPIVAAAPVAAPTTAPALTPHEGRVPQASGTRVAVPVVADAAAALQAQTTAAPAVVQPVTPENPIPRRIEGASPAWPAPFAGRQFQVAVSVLVTLDQKGGVTAIDPQGCAVAEGRTTGGTQDGVCAVFTDATTAALRGWRYERPSQAPQQFNVVVSFRPGSEPAITQSGTLLPIGAAGGSAGPTFLPDSAAILNKIRGMRTDEVMSGRLVALTSQYRELERAQRLVLERNPSNPDVSALQQRMAVLNDELAQLAAEMNRASREQLATVGPPGADATQTLVAPSGRQAYRVGGQIPAPRVLEEARPVYTPEAMAARVEGTVVMEALIDENGRVADARVVRSIPLLDQSARETLKYWRFTPTTLNGEPVPVIVQIEMHFRMR